MLLLALTGWLERREREALASNLQNQPPGNRCGMCGRPLAVHPRCVRCQILLFTKCD